jgi:cytochrome c oxidase subunit 2
MHAPNLTVQGGPYLLEQLRHFAHDIRGGPTDFYGWQMNGRAKALPDDAALRDVVAFVETLPRTRASPIVKGNVARGRELYSACASCHGARGEGSAGVAGGALDVVSGGGSTAPVGPVPALAGLDDYYQLAQLEAFTSGARGRNKDDDPQGAVMRAAAAGITSKEAARDVIAYMATIM